MSNDPTEVDVANRRSRTKVNVTWQIVALALVALGGLSVMVAGGVRCVELIADSYTCNCECDCCECECK